MSRINVGPLTTTFIPPPVCSLYTAETGGSQLSFYAGPTCGGGEDVIHGTECSPSASILGASFPTGNSRYYSPGLVCPSGYRTACTQIGSASTALSRAVTSSVPGFSFDAQPAVGETAVGCCPSGFTCSNYWHFGHFDYQTCIQEFTAPMFISVVSCSASAPSQDVVTTRVRASSALSRIHAPMIQLIYQSSDLSLTIAAQTNTATPSAGDGDAIGLSNGAKIGIGVGVPLSVLLIALGAFIFFRRRNARRNSPMDSDRLGRAEKSLQGKHEMPGQGGFINEMPVTKPATVHELSVQTSPR